jgi:ribonuclease HI
MKEKVKSSKLVQVWEAPNGDELKLNIDGSFCQSGRSGGWGFVIRNTNGDAMAAGAGSLPYSFDSLHYESASCREGIQWSSFWGMSKIRVETDSQTLVQAINSDAHDLFVNGHLFREIKFHGRLYFASFSVKICPRDCNRIADALATYGLKVRA